MVIELFHSVLFLPLTLHVVIELFEKNVLQEILVGKRQELWFSELPGDVGSRRRRIRKDFARDVIERPGGERENPGIGQLLNRDTQSLNPPIIRSIHTFVPANPPTD